MRSLRLMLCAGALCAAIPVGGCSTIASIFPSIGVSGPSSSLLDERAMADAEALYNSVIHAYNAAVAAGWVSEDVKAKVRPVVAKAHSARKAALDALHAGNASNLADQITALKALLADISALTPKGN